MNAKFVTSLLGSGALVAGLIGASVALAGPIEDRQEKMKTVGEQCGVCHKAYRIKKN